MKKCPYCGAEYPDDVMVCAIDQTPFERPSEPLPASDPGMLFRLIFIAITTLAIIGSVLLSFGAVSRALQHHPELGVWGHLGSCLRIFIPTLYFILSFLAYEFWRRLRLLRVIGIAAHAIVFSGIVCMFFTPAREIAGFSLFLHVMFLISFFAAVWQRYYLLSCKHAMFKKILFTVLWVVGCSLGSVFLLGIATVTLVAEKIKGFQPSEFAMNTLMAAWFVVPPATVTLTLILCIFGRLPGTRLSSKPSHVLPPNT